MVFERDGEELKKILFCNLDLLVRGFEGRNLESSIKNRDEFLKYINELCQNDDNIVCFISRDQNKLDEAKKHFDGMKYIKFIYELRKNAEEYIQQNKNRNHYFVFIGNKDVDFYLAVNTRSLFITPMWLPTEQKAMDYGVCVDTPIQLYKFILTLNNNNTWYSQLEIDDRASCISLMDARTYVGASISEKQMLVNFQQLLKNGTSRNYYEILLYHFLANMTNTTMFDDIELFGVIPNSNCFVNRDLFKFMEQVRFIKKKRLPCSLYNHIEEEQNLLIRHTPKQQMHIGSQIGRANIGGTQEFDSLYINPAYKDKIEKLKREKKLNVVIFDDYMNYGNGFNAVRCLLEFIGADKIIFVSMGIFRKEFQRKDYIISGNVYGAGYTYTLETQQVLKDYIINDSAKKEVDCLYDIFNKK